MVWPAILVSIGTIFGGFLLGKSSGSTGGIEVGSRNELPINLFGNQSVNRSTNSAFNVFSPQTNTQTQYAPQTFTIVGSPNASIRGSGSSAGQAPVQSTSPIFIPTGTGGQSGGMTPAPSESSSIQSMLLTGGLILGAVVIATAFIKKKK